MMRQRQIAIRAAHHMAARRTLNVRGKSATIEKQNHLPAVAQAPLRSPGAFAATRHRASCGCEIRSANRSCRPPAAADRTPAAAFRPGDIRPASRDTNFPATAWPRPAPAALFLRAPATAPHRGHDIAALLSCLNDTFVLFVEHDQTQMRHRSKHRAAGADDHLHFAAGDSFPMPMPLRVAQMTVQHGHAIEPGAKPFLGLRREADFRHQHDRLPAVADRLPESPECKLPSCRCR